MLKCYIIALLIPEIPKASHGEPKCKDRIAGIDKMLIDPYSIHTLTCRNERDELAQLFSNNFT